MSIIMILAGVLVLAMIALLFGAFFTVEQGYVGIVERFGKYSRTSQAGLNFKIPLIEIVREVDSRLQQLDVQVETKTKDNVFVNVKISVQFRVQDAEKATYQLADAPAQISAYVFDVIRAQVPSLGLDEVFEKKDTVADAVRKELTEAMDDFGFSIVKALVTDIDPDPKVKAAMNDINAATRHRQAAGEKAEADKIALIKAAEGEAEAKRLQGEGIAAQRKAIVDGLSSSIDSFQEAIKGSSAQEIMALIVTTQYFDTLKDIGAKGTNTILLPHSPGAVGDIQTQILAALSAVKKD